MEYIDKIVMSVVGTLLIVCLVALAYVLGRESIVAALISFLPEL